MAAANLSEFDLIDRYFKRSAKTAVVGIGDDAAIMDVTPGHQLLTSTDMLVAGTHFFADVDPADLGWKALAVNVSDLAAMGAKPRWALLALSLPAVDEAWLEDFSRGFFACADTFGVELIGGDTTRGPLNVCVTILGEAEIGKALLRSGARVGDDIWVSGHPGRAALGLAHLQGKSIFAQGANATLGNDALPALHRPQPRVTLGQMLCGIATAAIDVSDGLLADLGHILDASGVAAEIRIDQLPLLDDAIPEAVLRNHVLAGGDDYELAFTAAPAARAQIEALTTSLPLALTRIGTLVANDAERIRLLDAAGEPIAIDRLGYDHFK